MRRWDRAFRRASFRGARFWVESDGAQKGRRIAVMPVSGGDTAVVEDMGREAAEYQVRAYIASDLADVEGLALELACEAGGASLLVLPMDPPILAHCVSCRRNREKSRNGYVAYDLRFVPSGTMTGLAASGVAAVRNVFSAGLSAAASLISGAFR